MQVRVLPPVPPKPPKRGILKGPRLSNTSKEGNSATTTNHSNGISPDSKALLLKNTLQNELITYENVTSTQRSSLPGSTTMQSSTFDHLEEVILKFLNINNENSPI